MEEKECWNKFAATGRVEDYLEYRSSLENVTYNKDMAKQVSSSAADKGTSEGGERVVVKM